MMDTPLETQLVVMAGAIRRQLYRSPARYPGGYISSIPDIGATLDMTNGHAEASFIVEVVLDDGSRLFRKVTITEVPHP